MVNISELESRYVALYGKEPCGIGVIGDIERELGVRLPADFKLIAGFYSGGLLGGVSHHEIASVGAATNIVRETLRLRGSIALSDSYVVLAEPSGSVIFLDVSGRPAVIWCDAVEVESLSARNFINQPDVWGSYSDFFAYLLDEEEGERG